MNGRELGVFCKLYGAGAGPKVLTVRTVIRAIVAGTKEDGVQSTCGEHNGVLLLTTAL